jgi:hypothetical protein
VLGPGTDHVVALGEGLRNRDDLLTVADNSPRSALGPGDVMTERVMRLIVVGVLDSDVSVVENGDGATA